MTAVLCTRDELLEEFREFRDTQDRALRNHLVEAHRPLAIRLARELANRGEPLDDLMQVAQVALIHAVERFDPERDTYFTTFATVTISGELKRHFRDHTWSVHVPRRAQELHLRLSSTIAELSQRLGRSPSVEDLASEMSVDADAVLAAMDVGNAYRGESLDVAWSDDAGAPPRQFGDADSGYDAAECRLLVSHLLRSVSERDRRILVLRFYAEMTQAEIADDIGISQMHVSRVIARTLVSLRSAAATG